jgi:hypothetical protein
VAEDAERKLTMAPKVSPFRKRGLRGDLSEIETVVTGKLSPGPSFPKREILIFLLREREHSLDALLKEPNRCRIGTNDDVAENTTIGQQQAG